MNYVLLALAPKPSAIEEKKQENDRNRNAYEPEKNAASHDCVPHVEALSA
jgi:hypothetical protein